MTMGTTCHKGIVNPEDELPVVPYIVISSASLSKKIADERMHLSVSREPSEKGQHSPGLKRGKKKPFKETIHLKDDNQETKASIEILGKPGIPYVSLAKREAYLTDTSALRAKSLPCVLDMLELTSKPSLPMPRRSLRVLSADGGRPKTSSPRSTEPVHNSKHTKQKALINSSTDHHQRKGSMSDEDRWSLIEQDDSSQAALMIHKNDKTTLKNIIDKESKKELISNIDFIQSYKDMDYYVTKVDIR